MELRSAPSLYRVKRKNHSTQGKHWIPLFPPRNHPAYHLLQTARTYSRSELKPTAEPWYPAPSRSAASGEDHIVSKRLQQVLEQQQEALHVMAYSLQQALQMPKKEPLAFDGNPLNCWLFIKKLRSKRR